MTAGAWPESQAGWHAYAAELNARMDLLQLHVERDWLCAWCTCCGWCLELGRPDLSRFRFEVATHRCVAFEPVIMLVPELKEMLF